MITEVLDRMTQVLAQLTENQANNPRNANPAGNARVTIRDFLNLNPRNFDSPTQPLDADHWLREMSMTLSTTRVAPED